MPRFVEFATTSGRRALINPEHVALLTSDDIRDATSATTVYFVGDPQPLYVKGALDSVRAALTETAPV